jgi:hypothetical protein
MQDRHAFHSAIATGNCSYWDGRGHYIAIFLKLQLRCCCMLPTSPVLICSEFVPLLVSKRSIGKKLSFSSRSRFSLPPSIPSSSRGRPERSAFPLSRHRSAARASPSLVLFRRSSKEKFPALGIHSKRLRVLSKVITVTAASFVESAGRPSKPFWGPLQSNKLVLWGSLSEWEKEECNSL